MSDDQLLRAYELWTGRRHDIVLDGPRVYPISLMKAALNLDYNDFRQVVKEKWTDSVGKPETYQQLRNLLKQVA